MTLSLSSVADEPQRDICISFLLASSIKYCVFFFKLIGCSMTFCSNDISYPSLAHGVSCISLKDTVITYSPASFSLSVDSFIPSLRFITAHLPPITSATSPGSSYSFSDSGVTFVSMGYSAISCPSLLIDTKHPYADVDVNRFLFLTRILLSAVNVTTMLL